MYWCELSAAPTDGSYQESVTSVAFDGLYELVWAGTAGGRLLTYQSPDLSLCTYWPGHTHPVISLNPLPGSDLCLSVSADSALLSSSGGVKRTGYVDKAGQLQCACLEPGAAAARVALLGSAKGSITQLDLATGKSSIACAEVVSGEGVSVLRACPGRGLVALATTSGKLLLADPRNSWKVDASSAVSAHTAGVACLDVRDSRVACCGYSLRGGLPVPEPFLKVFDMRGSLLRPLLTLPFSGPSGCPTCLAFHPQMPSVLLVGCSRGGLALADTGVGTTTATYQVETGGGAVTSCTLSGVGEAWALGDVCSCVRLWAETATPRVHAVPMQMPMPTQGPHPAPPAVHLKEWDSFALAHKPPLDPAAGPRLLSDVERHVMMSVGLPPRTIEPALLQAVKQVDFVGHLANPHYVRGEKYGVASARVAALRNKRIEMKVPNRHKQDSAAQKAERSRKRAAQGGVMLPLRFHRVEIRAQSGLKFEEFDFSFYNRTRFAGLENDLPNAYANALLQVLYFTPELRAALLANHMPEPDHEFCLACELAMLFRMMVTSHGMPCQAANLLRALRQVREAAALGLLDSSSLSLVGGGAGTPGAGPDVANAAHHDATGLVEWALSRRCAALSRFLLDTLAKEGSQAKPTQAGQATPRSGIVQPAPGNASLCGLLEQVFGIPLLQRLQCLTGPTDAEGLRPQRTRDARIMQVDLAYPLCSSKAARIASDVGRLGFNRLPQAAATALGLTPQQQQQQQSRLSCSPDTAGGVLSTSPSTPTSLHALDPTTPTAGNAAAVGPKATAAALFSLSPGPAPAAAAAAGSGVTDGTQSPSPAGTPVVTPRSHSGGTGAAAAPGTPSLAAPHISFAEVLEHSLCSSQDTRAWFDDARGYAMVRQTRLPTSLPKVLVVSCAASEPADVEWWQPEMRAVQATDGSTRMVEVPRLPWALRLEVNQQEWRVRVRQGDSAHHLACLPAEVVAEAVADSGSGPVHDACYELCAVVAQVRDRDAEEPGEWPAPSSTTAGAGAGGSTPSGAGGRTPTSSGTRGSSGKPAEGHLVAMIRVPSLYATEQPLQCPCTEPPIGAGSPPPQPPTSLPKRHSASKTQEHAHHMVVNSSVRPHVMAAVAPIPLQGLDVLDKVELLDLPAVAVAVPPLEQKHQLGQQADGQSSTGSSSEAVATAHASMQGNGSMQLHQHSAAGGAGSNGTVTHSADSAGAAAAAAVAGAACDFSSTGSSSSLQGGSTTPAPPATAAHRGSTDGMTNGDSSAPNSVTEGWLLFNDFSVSPLLPHEVLSVYGGQKLPCLLHYRRVDNPLEAAVTATAAAESPVGTPRAAAQQPPPPTISPVLTPSEFAQLCRAPPLQGSSAHLEPARFVALDMSREAPRPGMLLALDAEFVMVSAPERLVDANLEVLTRQSRLSLGRVSVLRGEGPAAGTACIDDYVRVVEPVVDYLTRYSGLLPGDLEPSTSHHHLTTMKHAYLKLRYLADVGCVFVGHGLKKDLRIINITLPPQQVVDTVELYSRWRQRKMSLRFLASYLLGTNIQSSVHDSIEDARTALRLYELYKSLVASGTFQAKLDELYAWGARYGWEPVTLDRHGHPIPPAPTTTAPATT